jgi:hypothetical protein
MEPTIRRLSRLALLAIFCFGAALGTYLCDGDQGTDQIEEPRSRKNRG